MGTSLIQPRAYRLSIQVTSCGPSIFSRMGIEVVTHRFFLGLYIGNSDAQATLLRDNTDGCTVAVNTMAGV